jgi:hypothetical protein
MRLRFEATPDRIALVNRSALSLPVIMESLIPWLRRPALFGGFVGRSGGVNQRFLGGNVSVERSLGPEGGMEG